MKHKNEIEIIVFFVAALSLIISLFSILNGTSIFKDENIFLIGIICIFACCIVVMYLRLLFRQINPKQYIYISYTMADKEIVKRITKNLEEEFKKISKYHFEIITADTIPYGADMKEATHEFLNKSNVVLIIVSEDYVKSEWCKKEFLQLYKMDKKIIPIVTKSYKYLSELPNDISNIKALLIGENGIDDNLNNQISLLAKDLVRQRTD